MGFLGCLSWFGVRLGKRSWVILGFLIRLGIRLRSRGCLLLDMRLFSWLRLGGLSWGLLGGLVGRLNLVHRSLIDRGLRGRDLVNRSIENRGTGCNRCTGKGHWL